MVQDLVILKKLRILSRVRIINQVYILLVQTYLLFVYVRDVELRTTRRLHRFRNILKASIS
jgi:hypothetical protein